MADTSMATDDDADCSSVVSDTTRGSFDSPSVFQTSLKMLRIEKTELITQEENSETSSPIIAIAGPTSFVERVDNTVEKSSSQWTDQTQNLSDDDSMSCMSESLLTNTRPDVVIHPNLPGSQPINWESSQTRADNPTDEPTQEAEESQSLLATQIGLTGSEIQQANTDKRCEGIAGPSQKCLSNLEMVLSYLTNSSGSKVRSDEKHVMEKVKEGQAVIMTSLRYSNTKTDLSQWKACSEKIKSILSHLNRSHSDEREKLGRQVKQRGQSKSEKLSLRRQLQSLSTRQNILLTLFEKQKGITQSMRDSSFREKSADFTDSQVNSGSRSSEENKEVTSRSSSDRNNDMSTSLTRVKNGVNAEQNSQLTSESRSSEENKEVVSRSTSDRNNDIMSRSQTSVKNGVLAEQNSPLTSGSRSSEEDKEIPLRSLSGVHHKEVVSRPGDLVPITKKLRWEEIVGLSTTARADKSSMISITADITDSSPTGECLNNSQDMTHSDSSLGRPSCSSSTPLQLTSAGWTRKQTFPESFQEISSRCPTSSTVMVRKRKIACKNVSKELLQATQIEVGDKRLEVPGIDILETGGQESRKDQSRTSSSDTIKAIPHTIINKTPTNMTTGSVRYSTEAKIQKRTVNQIPVSVICRGDQRDQTGSKMVPVLAANAGTISAFPREVRKSTGANSNKRSVHQGTVVDSRPWESSCRRMVQSSLGKVESINTASGQAPRQILPSSLQPSANTYRGDTFACPAQPTCILILPPKVPSSESQSTPMKSVAAGPSISLGEIHNSQVPPEPQMVASQTDPTLSKSVTLSQLVKYGILRAGRNVISANVKDTVAFASLTEEGCITSSVGQFKTPARWLSAISGSAIKKSQAYKKVMYNGQFLSTFKIPADHMGDTKVRDEPLSNAEQSAQPPRPIGGSPVTHPSWSESQSACPSEEMFNISALLSRCTVRLIEDQELVPSSVFLPNNFWSTEFGQLEISEELWTSVEIW